jgi:NAD(P)-dependent dehydrogenase (short-subunit alcohol dehydrogenase family)
MVLAVNENENFGASTQRQLCGAKMDLVGKIVVVTGAGSGIGKSIATVFAQAGASHVICTDVDFDSAQATARACNGTALSLDVTSQSEIENAVATVEAKIGPIDLFVSNAGILTLGGVEVETDAWQSIWDVNVMAHVHAARALVPRMIARGGGYFLNTASAAGLLSQIGSAPYAVTKHAAIGFAEWLSLTHGDEGIKVSVLCPQGVHTAMTQGLEGHVAAVDGMMEADDVAHCCVQGLKSEEFLILPHPQVLDYMRMKTADYDRWLGGMRKLNRRFQ